MKHELGNVKDLTAVSQVVAKCKNYFSVLLAFDELEDLFTEKPA